MEGREKNSRIVWREDTGDQPLGPAIKALGEIKTLESGGFYVFSSVL